MKNKRLGIIIFFFLLQCVLQSVLANHSFASEKHFLWKVQSETNTVYLLGSFHLARKDFYPLDDVIEKAFDESKILVVEVDVTDRKREKIEKLLLDTAISKWDGPLKDNLSDETYKLLKKKIRQFRLSIIKMKKWKVWYTAIVLENLQWEKMGFIAKYGIDKYFLEKAGRRKILELETPGYQIRLFDRLSKKEQETLLYYTLLSFDELPSQADRLVKSWQNGDTKTLSEIFFLSQPSHRCLESICDKIIYDRNKSMAHRISGFLYGHVTHFVIVGAAHLVGEESIVALLSKKGYSVEQL